MRIKQIIITILALVILGSIGSIPNNIYIHPTTIKATRYPKTRYYQRTVYRKATSKIRYYQKWYHYWAKKNYYNDKLLNPIFYKSTPRERRLYHLDYYYSSQEAHCENNEFTWSDIKYAIYKYPISHKSARNIIYQLYKYGIGKHNNNLNEYLLFCHKYHMRPAYHTHQWHKQLIYYMYEE